MFHLSQWYHWQKDQTEAFLGYLCADEYYKLCDGVSTALCYIEAIELDEDVCPRVLLQRERGDKARKDGRFSRTSEPVQTFERE